MPDLFPPSDPEYGNDCLRCYAAGLTPLTFAVTFSGIMMGDLWVPADGAPPNGTYFLPQTNFEPCLWAEWPVSYPWPVYSVGAVWGEVSYYVTAVVQAFHQLAAPRCRRDFINTWQLPAGAHFYGGTATVIPPWEVDEIVEDVTPIVDPDPLLQIMSMPNNRAVVSYIDSWGDTKLKILVDFTLR